MVLVLVKRRHVPAFLNRIISIDEPGVETICLDLVDRCSDARQGTCISSFLFTLFETFWLIQKHL